MVFETRGKPRRSVSLKKIRVRVPGSSTVTHYKYAKHAKPACGICGAELHGVAAGRPSEIRKLARSERRPERPFGGVLCSDCMRKILILRAQVKFKEVRPEEIPISLRSYVNYGG
ncbi:MAG: 50S ribosomal protein L34e [DPANN group archaeon]|nr:50S ribosomal protein L34e [DPANN group archaeon]